MRERQPAICLRTSDFSETSQVLHFLTRGAGVVHLLAKGAKRPKSASGGAVDLLSEGDLVYIPGSGESLGTLVEFTETAVRARLRRSAERLNGALYMIELVGAMLAAADPHPEVFDLLHAGLARLDRPDSSPPAVLAYFQWRLLRHVGLMGELDRCVGCGGPAGPSAFFSSAQGGLLCAACEGSAAEKIPVDGAARGGLAALAAAAAGRRVRLRDDQARAANRLLAYHAAHQIGRPLRMARHAIE